MGWIGQGATTPPARLARGVCSWGPERGVVRWNSGGAPEGQAGEAVRRRFSSRCSKDDAAGSSAAPPGHPLRSSACPGSVRPRRHHGRPHVGVEPSVKEGCPLDAANVSAAFGRLAERAKHADIRFHDFRHTFCTRMVEQGADLITLKEITGHKRLAMLQRYSHPSDARKLALVRTLPVLHTEQM
jgi:integrase